MNDELRALIADTGKQIDQQRVNRAKEQKRAAELERQYQLDKKRRQEQENNDYLSNLVNEARYLPSMDTQLKQAFPQKDEAGNVIGNPPVDDGYIAFIGVTPEHNVFGGDPNRWTRPDNSGAVGTWRNGSRNIRNITHISIFGYMKDGGIGSEKHLVEMLEIARQFNPFAAALVRVFDNNGKSEYTSLDELKDDLGLVLSKIYHLDNPRSKG